MVTLLNSNALHQEKALLKYRRHCCLKTYRNLPRLHSLLRTSYCALFTWPSLTQRTPTEKPEMLLKGEETEVFRIDNKNYLKKSCGKIKTSLGNALGSTLLWGVAFAGRPDADTCVSRDTRCLNIPLLAHPSTKMNYCRSTEMMFTEF